MQTSEHADNQAANQAALSAKAAARVEEYAEAISQIKVTAPIHVDCMSGSAVFSIHLLLAFRFAVHVYGMVCRLPRQKHRRQSPRYRRVL